MTEESVTKDAAGDSTAAPAEGTATAVDASVTAADGTATAAEGTVTVEVADVDTSTIVIVDNGTDIFTSVKPGNGQTTDDDDASNATTSATDASSQAVTVEAVTIDANGTTSDANETSTDAADVSTVSLLTTLGTKHRFANFWMPWCRARSNSKNALLPFVLF